MKNMFLIGVLLIFANSLSAQIGISSAYYPKVADNWVNQINSIGNEDFSSPTGYSFGLDYRLRLINKRIEFFPTLSYSIFDQTYRSNQMEVRLSGFHLNTNIYLFDLEGDCDCPTWSKSGSIFEKGFFLQLAPGVSSMDVKFSEIIVYKQKEKTFFELGLGAGIDIGLSKVFTLTPLIKYYITPENDWIGSTATDIIFTEYTIKTSPSRLFAGIRLGFNLDNGR